MLITLKHIIDWIYDFLFDDLVSVNCEHCPFVIITDDDTMELEEILTQILKHRCRAAPGQHDYIFWTRWLFLYRTISMSFKEAEKAP